MPETWFISEVERPVAEAGTRVFSFAAEGSDAGPEDVMDPVDEYRIYDEVYESVLSGLSAGLNDRRFFHREVHFGWAFKKKIFEYVFYAVIRHEILRRFVERHPTADFWVSGVSGNWAFPRLCEIIPHGPLSDRIHVRPEPPQPPVSKTFSWRRLWPAKIAKGDAARETTAFFSDWAKTRGVMSHFVPRETVVFTRHRSPHLFFKSCREDFGFYQVDAASNPAPRPNAPVLEGLRDLGEYFKGMELYGVSIRPLVEHRCREIAAREAPVLALETDAVYEFFGRRPGLRSALLDEDVSPLQNAFCQAAKAFKVKTFVELHGALGHAIGYLPLTADFILVWTEAQKDKLRRWGCAAERIRVTGSSRYRRYREKNDVECRAQVSRDLHLDPAKKILLVAFTQVKPPRKLFLKTLGSVVNETLTTVENVLKARSIQVIVKLHPGDGEANRRRIFDWVEHVRPFFTARAVENYDPLLLAKAADALVVYRSTYALDAYALGRPAILLYDSTCPMLEEFRPYNIFHYAESPHALERFLRDFFEKGEPAASRPRPIQIEGEVPADAAIARCLSAKTNYPKEAGADRSSR